MGVTVGIDEVGRGSLAGPLVAAAVIIDQPIAGLTDSKLLTRPRREKLEMKIRELALAIGIGWVTAKELDEIGLTQAVRSAMERALGGIKLSYDLVIIDGNYNFLAENAKSKCIIKADLSEPSVSAASIIAKVARDEFMIKLSTKYPEYGFDTNVGYGTKHHLDMLDKHGFCDIHRRSFDPVKQIVQVV